jgi:general secretion pathway protein C
MRISHRRLLTLANSFLALMLSVALFTLARDAVLYYKPGKRVKAEEKPVLALEKLAKRSLADYAPVLSNNAFGFPAGQLTPIERRQEATPEAIAVNVTLAGTVAWPGRFGYAVIADASGEQRVYKTGDYILGAGTLKRVEKDRVIIDAEDRQVEVKLTEIAAVKEIANAPQPAGGGFARMTQTGSYIVDQKAIQSALENPRQIMTDARLLPNMADGKQEGFVIREIKPGGVYQTLGLQNGDVLLRINEFTMSNPETALQAFTALRGMSRVELDIFRDGSRMTLTYTIR